MVSNFRDLIIEIREKLKNNLAEEKDPAMILHLSVTLVFYAVSAGRLVHAPGKAIPLMISALSKLIPSPVHQRLVEMQSNRRRKLSFTNVFHLIFI